MSPPPSITQEHAARRFQQVAEIERQITAGEVAIEAARQAVKTAKAVLQELEEVQAERIAELRGAARDEGPLSLPFDELAEGQVPS